MLRTRTHAKTLVRPAVILVVLGGAVGVGTALVPSPYRPAGQYVVVLAVLALAWWWSVRPYLRWLSHTYTLTNHRLLTRQGVLSQTGHDLPLSRILNVSYQRRLADRMFGGGTLVVRTASPSPTGPFPTSPGQAGAAPGNSPEPNIGGSLVLADVPDVEQVHLVMTELLYARPRAQLGPMSLPTEPHYAWSASLRPAFEDEPAGRRR